MLNTSTSLSLIHISDAIRQLGCEVTLLSASDLEQRDLSEFDAIVTGVRAYNTRADLRVNLPRLLDYVRNGGKLIDQYNVTDGNLVPMGPYPVSYTHLDVYKRQPIWVPASADTNGGSRAPSCSTRAPR